MSDNVNPYEAIHKLTLFFNNPSQWAKNLCVILFTLTACFIAVTYLALPKWAENKDAFNFTDEQIEKAAQDAVMLQRKIDSIVSKEIEKNRLDANRAKYEIENEAVKLSYTIPNINNVTFWGTEQMTDSVGELKWKVYVSSSKGVESDYSQPEIMPEGFKWMVDKVRENSPFYMSDVENESQFYKGKVINIFRSTGSKSLITSLVKTNGTNTYLVTFSFNIKHPYDTNTSLYGQIRSFRRFVQERM